MLRKWSNRSLFWRTALATIARLDRIEAIDARKAVLEVERQWLLSKHRVEVMIHDNAQYLSQLYTAKPVGPASGPSHMTVATRNLRSSLKILFFEVGGAMAKYSLRQTLLRGCGENMLNRYNFSVWYAIGGGGGH
jgi:hypothetical protein